MEELIVVPVKEQDIENAYVEYKNKVLLIYYYVNLKKIFQKSPKPDELIFYLYKNNYIYINENDRLSSDDIKIINLTDSIDNIQSIIKISSNKGLVYFNGVLLLMDNSIMYSIDKNKNLLLDSTKINYIECEL